MLPVAPRLFHDAESNVWFHLFYVFADEPLVNGRRLIELTSLLLCLAENKERVIIRGIELQNLLKFSFSFLYIVGEEQYLGQQEVEAAVSRNARDLSLHAAQHLPRLL